MLITNERGNFMHLQTYLKDNNIGISEFAKILSVSRNTIWNWMSGSWYPSPRNMRKIESATRKEVTFIDMMEMYKIKHEGRNLEEGTREVVSIADAW